VPEEPIDLELPEIEEPEDTPDLKARSYNLAKRKPIRDKLIELYSEVMDGFDNQRERACLNEDYWDAFNCILANGQTYNGNSQIFAPILQNAIAARVTRFSNQIFPPTGRYVDCISSDGTLPQAMMALAEYYVRKANLQDFIPALMANGDVEGQYTVYVSWDETVRHVVTKEKVMSEDGLEPFEDIKEEEIKAAHPAIEIIADNDLCVLPATSDTLQAALTAGGSVTVLRRWSESKIKQLIKDKQIDKALGESLTYAMSTESVDRDDKSADMVCAAGIKGDARGKFALIYETWSMVETPEGDRLCRTYFGGGDKVLSCVRNPLWCDRLPIISCPVKKVQGSFKGRSPTANVIHLQYYANDILNEGADSSMYAMLPIIMTDPEKNPRVSSMVLNLAAVWQTSPNDTQFAKFPDLWKDALELVNSLQGMVFQTLSVNPSMITAGAPYRKPTQAETANEQAVDVLTTANAVTVIEGGVLTPLLELFMDMDHQYRDEAIAVRAYGDLGRRMNMQEIEPLQMGNRYEFKWFGVEQARSAQTVQQQIAYLNVLNGVTPDKIPGYRINLAPFLIQATSNVLGPRLAPLVLEDIKTQLEYDPKEEVQLALEGIETPVYPNDNHQVHMQLLQQALQENGDEHGTIRAQMVKRKLELQAMMMEQQMPMGGPPGAAPPGQGGSGPRPGGQPEAPPGGQGPAGMIHQDQISDPTRMPRAVG
jgi:hypothetical protein